MPRVSDQTKIDTDKMDATSAKFDRAASEGHALARQAEALLYPPDKPWGSDQTGEAFEKGFYGGSSDTHTRNGRPRASVTTSPAGQIVDGLKGIAEFLDQYVGRLKQASGTYSDADHAARDSSTQVLKTASDATKNSGSDHPAS